MTIIETLTAARNEANSAYNAAKVAANPTMDTSHAILVGSFSPAAFTAAQNLRTAQANLDAAWGAAA